MKKIILFLSLIGFSTLLHAQKDEKTAYQAVKEQCSGMALEKRARISVTRFSVTTRTGDPEVARNANANNRLKAISVIRFWW